MDDKQRQAILDLFEADRLKMAAMSPDEQREYARASLVQQGILTEEGELAPQYGGPGCAEYYGLDDAQNAVRVAKQATEK